MGSPSGLSDGVGTQAKAASTRSGTIALRIKATANKPDNADSPYTPT